MIRPVFWSKTLLDMWIPSALIKLRKSFQIELTTCWVPSSHILAHFSFISISRLNISIENSQDRRRTCTNSIKREFQIPSSQVQNEMKPVRQNLRKAFSHISCHKQIFRMYSYHANGEVVVDDIEGHLSMIFRGRFVLNVSILLLNHSDAPTIQKRRFRAFNFLTSQRERRDLILIHAVHRV